ncbi:MAG: phosphate signaling complex protein PhoU [Betaproteobacteria bacterium]|nr:phosphate signaling complex protein PhoU [Betaproteobacteria bacterium]MDE2622520.1 phosphate signaling complex protein PhoU [Betaproteobacteria bacterium]
MGSEHTSKQFDAELEAVRAKVIKMGGQVEAQIAKALRALQEGDMGLAECVIAGDDEVNALEVSIDEDCNRIIALRQPEAGDLRFVLATIKTITDLERMGDEAEKVARMAKAIHQSPHAGYPEMVNFRQAGTLALAMAGKALDAFVRLDVELATQVLREDRDLDRVFHGIMRQVVAYSMEGRHGLAPAIDAIFAAKALERIGDHAKNMAEYVIFLVKGKDVRHISMEQLEREVGS